jgi:hypothetical protein
MKQANLVQTLSPKKRKTKLVLTSLKQTKVKGIGRKYNQSSDWLWMNKNGAIKVKNLEFNHIRSILSSLKPSELRFNGHSANEWIKALKTEMDQRNELADSLLATIFPKFRKVHTEAVQAVLQHRNNG